MAMGNTLLSLLVKLGLDTSDYDEGVDKSKAKAKGLGSSLAKMGGAAVVGGLVAVGTAAAATGAFLASTIEPASDLNETLSKNSVVFGEYSGAMEKWSAGAGAALGMSQNAALGAAATYGNLFRAMGLTENASFDMSKGLVQLAGDLGSFNNLPTADVLEKLRAGLTGEAEPLKSLGININEVAIQQKALNMGLVKNIKGITPAIKAQAVYALMLEQTTLAQGDFARTSGGLANQQKILAAQFENVKAQIGTAMLPALQSLAGTMITLFSDPAVIAGIANLANWLAVNLPIAIETLSKFWSETLWPALQEVWAWVNSSLIPTLTVIWNWLSTNIPPAIQALATFWTGTLLPAIQAVSAWILTTLVPTLQIIWNWLSVNIPLAINTFLAFWNGTFWPALQGVWAWINEYLVPLFQALGEVFSVLLTLAVQGFTDLWNNALLPAIQAVWGFIQGSLVPVLQQMWSWIAEKLQPAAAAISTFLGYTLVDSLRSLEGMIRSVIGWIKRLAAELAKLVIPKALTPGSPTPFEIGLRGIASAMRKLSTTELPRMQAEMDLVAPKGIQASVGLMDGQRGNTYNIFTKDNPGQIHNALTLSALMGGAA